MSTLHPYSKLFLPSSKSVLTTSCNSTFVLTKSEYKEGLIGQCTEAIKEGDEDQAYIVKKVSRS